MRGGRIGRWSRKAPPSGAATLLLAALTVMAAGLPLGSASATSTAPRASASPTVLAIVQGPARITEHSGLTVSVEMSDPSAVHFAYYTFCRLGNAVCYVPPITLVRQGSTAWFVGTTLPMAQYQGMDIGTQAGYNITIELTDNTNLTEPALPNPFTNLTTALSVSGENLYEITVQSNVYTLSGSVYDASDHAPIAGATVSIGPAAHNVTTGSTGAYSFAGLTNGSYNVVVVKSGYYIGTQSVSVSGANATQDVLLSNGSAPTPRGSAAPSNFFESPLFLGTIAVVAAVAVVAALLLRRRPGRNSPAPPGTAAPSPPVAEKE